MTLNDIDFQNALKQIDEAVYKYIDQLDDIDEDLYVQLNQLIKKSGLHITNDVKAVAVEDDEVIGALFTGIENLYDDPEGKEIMYSFDVIVDPDFKVGTIGIDLIDMAFEEYNELNIEFDDKVLMYVNVVNPRLAKYLVKVKGLTKDKKSHGSFYMK